MAETSITIPGLEQLSQTSISFEYDRRSDSLYIHLAPPGSAGVSVAVDEHMLLRLHPKTSEVIGVEIESFLNSAVVENPELLMFAELAEIPSTVMDNWRQTHLSSDVGSKAVHDLLESTQTGQIA